MGPESCRSFGQRNGCTYKSLLRASSDNRKLLVEREYDATVTCRPRSGLSGPLQCYALPSARDGGAIVKVCGVPPMIGAV